MPQVVLVMRLCELCGELAGLTLHLLVQQEIMSAGAGGACLRLESTIQVQPKEAGGERDASAILRQ